MGLQLADFRPPMRGGLGNDNSRAWHFAAGKGFRRGLVLVCSQKTLSVAALMIPQLASDPSLALTASGAGVAMIVAVFVYIAQLALDFLIASRWASMRM